MLFFAKNFKKCAGVLDRYVEQFFKIFHKKEHKYGPLRKMLNTIFLLPASSWCLCACAVSVGDGHCGT